MEEVDYIYKSLKRKIQKCYDWQMETIQCLPETTSETYSPNLILLEIPVICILTSYLDDPDVDVL